MDLSRGLGDVYKRQCQYQAPPPKDSSTIKTRNKWVRDLKFIQCQQ
jgi:hypothetical protein